MFNLCHKDRILCLTIVGFGVLTSLLSLIDTALLLVRNRKFYLTLGRRQRRLSLISDVRVAC